ncbi:MAG: protein kinase domain-containing protein [Myxococcaceae bacterium]
MAKTRPTLSAGVGYGWRESSVYPSLLAMDASIALGLDEFSGRKLGKYEVLCRLSTGGMSEIFLAFQRGLAGFRKFVVLKQILPDIKGEEQFVRMFLDEAKITAAFAHPNIAQVYDLDIQDGELFLTMEFVPGATLVEVAKACYDLREPIPIGFSIASVRDTALALHYAHTFTDPAGRAQQVIHRDIAEKNIMVTYEGVTKLLDFGIAKQANGLSRTLVGTVKGTSGYMSPEQVLGNKLDPRSDVFSLGVVLHELLTGVRLFGSGRGSAEEDLLAPVNEKVEPPSRQNPGITPELDAVVLKALAQLPEQRFASSKDFARELEKVGAPWIWDAEQCGELIRRLFNTRRTETAALLETSDGGDCTGFTKVAMLLTKESDTNPGDEPPMKDVLPFPRSVGRQTALLPKSDPNLVVGSNELAGSNPEDTSRTSPERPKAFNEWGANDEVLENATSPTAPPQAPLSDQRTGEVSTDRTNHGLNPKALKGAKKEPVTSNPPSVIVVNEPLTSGELKGEPAPGGEGAADDNARDGELNNGEGPTVMDPPLRPERRSSKPTPQRASGKKRTAGSSTGFDRSSPEAHESRKYITPNNVLAQPSKSRGGGGFLIGLALVVLGSLSALAVTSRWKTPPPPPPSEIVEATSLPAESTPPKEPLVTKEPLVAKEPGVDDKPEPQRVPDEQQKPTRRKRQRETRRVSRERDERPGALTLNTAPYSTVFLSGKNLGLTPLFKVELPPGKHALRVVGADNKPRRLMVEIEPGATRKLEISLRTLPLE